MDQCEFQGGQVVDGEFVEACPNVSILFQPPHALRDHRTTAIRLAIKTMTSIIRLLVAPTRDHVIDPRASQPTSNAWRAVTLSPANRSEADPI